MLFNNYSKKTKQTKQKKQTGGHYKTVSKCKYDIPGYFIINGNEKVIISQEKIASNIIQVFDSKNKNIDKTKITEEKIQI